MLSRLSRLGASFTVGALVIAFAAPRSDASGLAISSFGGDASQLILGDGTGVVVGLVDSGTDAAHPFLNGLDSMGRPREVARANFVPTESSNLGEDLNGHGTFTASVALGRGEVAGVRYDGPAPDARYINARVLDRNARWSSEGSIVDAVGFAVANGADVLNLSLSSSSSISHGDTRLDLLLDYVVDAYGVPVVVAAGNFGVANAPHRMGAARNALSVGALDSTFEEVASFSSGGPTSDGRSKPDLVAPGESLTGARLNGAPDNLLRQWDGTSYSAAAATGVAAQLIDYGQAHGLSVDPRVLRAVLMNSAAKSLDADGAAWSHTPTEPLDDQQGAGALDALAAAEQYLGGQFGIGDVPPIGWAFEALSGLQSVDATSASFLVGDLAIGTFLDVTAVWNRPVEYTDRGALGTIDAADEFTPGAQSDLNLHLLRDGQLIAESASPVDTVEHLHFLVDAHGRYEVRVSQATDSSATPYALAWRGAAVPEPSGLALAAVGLLSIVGWRTRGALFAVRSTAAARPTVNPRRPLDRWSETPPALATSPGRRNR